MKKEKMSAVQKLAERIFRAKRCRRVMLDKLPVEERTAIIARMWKVQNEILRSQGREERPLGVIK